MFRIIGEVRPRYALIENVPALTFRGGTRVIGDLAEIGYDTEWQIVGADDVGAPHRRKRIWIVAYANCESESNGSQHEQWMETEDVAYSNSKREIGNKSEYREGCGFESRSEDVADPECEGLERWKKNLRPKERWVSDTGHYRSKISGNGRDSKWITEPDVGRVAHGVPNRVDRLRGLGNAIVPQVAYEIIRCLK